MNLRLLFTLACALPSGLYPTLRIQAAESKPTVSAQDAAARTKAPIDLTGYWVSVITEDWRYRMITPGKGEYAGIPLNLDGKNTADAWDPAKDEQAGEECKSYGVGAVMRVPGRLHITWADANTLKVELDAGKQTRLLRFDAELAKSGQTNGAERTWQGQSTAVWEKGSLKVVTRMMRAGYLRKNGVPYSEKAQLTEYWNVHREKNGDQWLVITSILEDPTYLQEPYVFSPNFQKEPEGSKWEPTSCSARW